MNFSEGTTDLWKQDLSAATVMQTSPKTFSCVQAPARLNMDNINWPMLLFRSIQLDQVPHLPLRSTDGDPLISLTISWLTQCLSHHENSVNWEIAIIKQHDIWAKRSQCILHAPPHVQAKVPSSESQISNQKPFRQKDPPVNLVPCISKTFTITNKKGMTEFL